MSLGAGTRLGSFEIIESLGRGGMGEVYRARDLKLGRSVALKVLDEAMARDRERLRRFEQESRAASALNHPNLVHIYDVGDAEGSHYIAMELVEGETLRAALARERFSAERMLDVARQIAEGLAKAHDAGIVHRDLKPENVMVTEDGFVKILDFGLAKLTESLFDDDDEGASERATVARTRHGMLLGTVEYMSPEQASGKSVSFRSDQFSLGLILYEMATGELAFHRDTAAQTLASIIESEPPAIEDRSTCPEDYARVVARCLEKDPAGRYESTRDIATALKDAQVRERVSRSDGAKVETETVNRDVPPVSPAPPPPPPPTAAANGASLGDGISVFVGETMDEVQRELREAFGEAVYEIRSRDGRRRKISEKSLRKRLRRNRFSGVEMVRAAGEDAWKPLYDTEIFHDEIGGEGDGDPADWARKRKVMGFFQHLCSFVGVGAMMTIITGQFPFWLGFWGIGLGAHAIDTIPAALALYRRRQLQAGTQDASVKAVGAGVEQEKIAAPAQTVRGAPGPVVNLLSDTFTAEVTRVKELLDRRGGENQEALIAEVDRIVERMTELVSRERDLEEQTAEAERDELRESEDEARKRAENASSVSDRKLYQRQLDVIVQRREAIDKALVVLSRLRVRREVAEHQLKQLRLDLSRAEASTANVPELTSRLQDIRHEVDATEAVDEAIARELSS